MADIRTLNSSSPQIRPELSPVGNTEVKTGSRPENADLTEEKKKQLPDLISVSDDGDTVQAGLIARLRLGDDRQGRVIPLGKDAGEDPVQTGRRKLQGSVSEQAALSGAADVEKPEVTKDPETGRIELKVPGNEEDPLQARREREEREEAREEAEVKRAEMTNFVGYTDSELEQLYLKGEISKQKYDQEMESRKEQEEAEAGDAREFSKELGSMSASQNAGERLAQVMNAFSPDANNTVSPEDRIRAIQAAEQGRQQEDERNMTAVTTA